MLKLERNTKINITDTSYLLWDGQQFMSYVFVKGGAMVRSPRTGETIETKDKFSHLGTYLHH